MHAIVAVACFVSLNCFYRAAGAAAAAAVKSAHSVVAMAGCFWDAKSWMHLWSCSSGVAFVKGSNHLVQRQQIQLAQM